MSKLGLFPVLMPLFCLYSLSNRPSFPPRSLVRDLGAKSPTMLRLQLLFGNVGNTKEIGNGAVSTRRPVLSHKYIQFCGNSRLATHSLMLNIKLDESQRAIFHSRFPLCVLTQAFSWLLRLGRCR